MKTITFVYITNSITTEEVTIKDFSFQWNEIFWGDSAPSITGKNRNMHRGWQPVLTLEFEHNDTLRSVAETIYTTLQTGSLGYIVDEETIVYVVPDEFQSEERHQWKLKRQPERLVLIGNLSDTQNDVPVALEIRLAGATSHTGDVIARWKTTKLAESKIHWGIDKDNLDTSMVYNNDPKVEHEFTFPTSFVGSFHYFKAFSRDLDGNEVSTDVLGIYFIQGEFEIEAVLFTTTTLQIISVTSITQEHGGFTVASNIGPDGNPKPTLTAAKQALSQPTTLDVQGDGDGFSMNVTTVVT